jgi:GAF domain-containing protein
MPMDDLKKQMAADAVFASLEACVAQVQAWIGRSPAATGAAPAGPTPDETPVATLEELGLGRIGKRRFESLARQVAQDFGVPIALVTFVDDVHRDTADGGAPADAASADKPVSGESLDLHVIATDTVIVSEDVTTDPRFADDPHVLEKGIRFYAGAPLRTSQGVVIGTLCLIDTQPRDFPEAEGRRLQAAADALAERLGTEASAPAPPEVMDTAPAAAVPAQG